MAEQRWVDDWKNALARTYAANGGLRASAPSSPNVSVPTGNVPIGRGPVGESFEDPDARATKAGFLYRNGSKLVDGFLDIILSGNYASAQAFEAVVDAGEDPGLNRAEDAKNFAKSLVGAGPVGSDAYKAFFRTFFAGVNREQEDKDTFSDVLAKAGYDNPAAVGTAGFALDVAADPITYIPGGLIAKGLAKGGAAARGAMGLGKGSDLFEQASRIGETAEPIIRPELEGSPQRQAILPGENPVVTDRLNGGIPTGPGLNVERTNGAIPMGGRGAAPEPSEPPLAASPADVAPGTGQALSEPPSPLQAPASPMPEAQYLESLSEAMRQVPIRETTARNTDDLSGLFEKLKTIETTKVPTAGAGNRELAESDLINSVVIRNSPNYEFADGTKVADYLNNPGKFAELEDKIANEIRLAETGDATIPDVFQMYTYSSRPLSATDQEDVVAYLVRAENNDETVRLSDGRNVPARNILQTAEDNPGAWPTILKSIQQTEEFQQFRTGATVADNEDFFTARPDLVGDKEKLAYYVERPETLEYPKGAPLSERRAHLPPKSPTVKEAQGVPEVDGVPDFTQLGAKSADDIAREKYLLPFKDDYDTVFVRSDSYTFQTVKEFALGVRSVIAEIPANSTLATIQREVIKTQKLKKGSKAYKEWEETVRKVVSLGLMKKLATAGSEKQFMDIVATAVSSKSPGGFQAVSELEAAYKAGFIDKEDLVKFFSAAGLGNPEDVSRNFARLTSKVEANFRRLAKTDTPKELPATEKAAVEVTPASQAHVDIVQDIELPKADPNAFKPAADYVESQRSIAVAGYDSLPPAVREISDNAIRSLLKTHFKIPVEKWQFKTNGRSYANTPINVEGLAVNRAFNKPKQVDFAVRVNKSLEPYFKSDEWIGQFTYPSKNSKKKPYFAYYKERQARFELLRQILTTADAALRAEGIQPVISEVGHTGKGISMGDIFTHVGLEGVDDIFGQPFWVAIKTGGRTSIPDDKIAQIADIALDVKFAQVSREVAEAEIDKIVRDVLKNRSAGIAKSITSAQKNNIKLTTEEYISGFSKSVREAFLRSVSETDSGLYRQMVDNHFAAGVAKDAEVMELTDGLIVRLIELADNPSMTVGGLNAEELVAKLASAKTPITNDIWTVAPKSSEVAAASTVDAKLRILEAMGPNSAKEAVETAKVVKGSVVAASTRHNVRRAEAADIDDAFRADAGSPVGEKGKRLPAPEEDARFYMNGTYDAAAGATNAIVRSMTTALSYVNPRIGNRAFNEVVWKNRNAISAMTEGMVRKLNKINNTLIKVAGSSAEAKKLAQVTFSNYQKGIVPEGTVAEAYADMHKMMDVIFQNLVKRNRLDVNTLNARMATFGVDTRWHFDGKTAEAALSSWKNWPAVDDPLDQFAKLYAASQLTMAEDVVGRELASMLTEKSLLRNNAKAGWVKIVTTDEGMTAFTRGIEGKYMPKEIAVEVQNAIEFMRRTTGTSTDTTNQFFKKYYDPILSAFKAGLTIYRPGHHMRNFYGDATLSFLAGVTDPRVYGKAYRIMANIRGDSFDGFNMVAFREGIEKNQAIRAGSQSRVTVGKTQMTDLEVYNSAIDEGILPSYNLVEDIIVNQDTFSPIDRLKTTISQKAGTRGRVQRAAAGISEARDHYVRIAHFVDSIEKHGKKMSREDAIAQAGRDVRKWHPDGSNLTPQERNVARRLFTFYSWAARALPISVEAALIQPGRTLIYPKAMYALGEANGIDLESMQEPFPNDAFFPEFLTDSMTGVQFEGENPGTYYGINPGNPQADLFDDFGGSHAGKSLVASLSPWIRIPIETAQGRTVTGIPINDKTDYIDQQIPLVNVLANLTNRSVSSGFTQAQRDAEPGRGNNAPIDTIALTNLLTGIGLQNKTKPNYLPIAEQEMGRELQRQAERRLSQE